MTIKPTKKYKPNKKESFKYLHEKAWKLISMYVRQQGMDKDGHNKCYTCEVVRHWKELQCGHYHHGKGDFELKNLKPQCAGCNKFRHGNLSIYGTKLSQEIGVAGMKKLLLKVNTTKYTCQDLKRIIKRYTKLLGL